MRLRAGAAVLVGLLLALTTSCGGDDDDAESGNPSGRQEAGDGDTSTTEEESTTTTLSPEEEVVAAYRSAQDALAAAYAVSDPNHPDLVARWGGEALSRLQNLLTQYAAQDVGYVGTAELSPVVSTLVGDSATVTDCIVDRTQGVRLSTGEQFGESSETIIHIDSQLERVNGAWVIMQEQELTEPCAP